MYTGLKVSCFKDRFQELFAESEKTNMDLGKDLHVSNQTISAWKLGVRSPKEPTVIAIAAFFNVSPQWLLGFDVQKEPYNPISDALKNQRTPVVVPDSKEFLKLIHYMPQEDYIMVMEAFERASERMKEETENAKSGKAASE